VEDILQPGALALAHLSLYDRRSPSDIGQCIFNMLREFVVKVVNAFLAVISISRQHKPSEELSQAGLFDLEAQSVSTWPVPALDVRVHAEQR
jgi:hypothetical protein